MIVFANAAIRSLGERCEKKKVSKDLACLLCFGNELTRPACVRQLQRIFVPFAVHSHADVECVRQGAHDAERPARGNVEMRFADLLVSVVEEGDVEGPESGVVDGCQWQFAGPLALVDVHATSVSHVQVSIILCFAYLQMDLLHCERIDLLAWGKWAAWVEWFLAPKAWNLAVAVPIKSNGCGIQSTLIGGFLQFEILPVVKVPSIDEGDGVDIPVSK